MSEIVPLSMRKSGPPKMRIGLLRLTDGAPVIAAHEFGFFAEEGLEVELTIEPSWANIADKLAYGFFDAAVIVPPLAFAVQLGLRGAAQPIVIPYAISACGNTVTLSTPMARQIRERAAREACSTVMALANCLREQPTRLGIVHAYSTHNLLLRYWLATAGIDAGRDVEFVVVPPARAVEALSSGQIAGFCAGAPWGEVARRAEAGVTVATSWDIWQNAPEKAFAIRARWAEENPELVHSALRALLRAAKFCDAPENGAYTAALLARRKYLDVDSHAILASLPGGAAAHNNCVFFRGAATFPWRSHALWFLREMRRWRLIDVNDPRPLAESVYRPDIYRAALGPSGEAVPAADWKTEGGHETAWFMAGSPAAIPMPPDRFCDGKIFDPEAVEPAPAPTKSALHNL